MTNTIRPSVARQTALALAVSAFCAVVQAAEPENTEATITFGLSAPMGGAREDRALFNQYRGLTSDGANGVLDLSYFRRNPDNGTAVRFDAADLFGDSRSLDLRWTKQGEWKLRVDYHELLHRDVNTLHSGLLGAGTATPQVQVLGAGNAGGDLNLRLKRTGMGVAVTRVIDSAWQFEASLKGEKKEGSRLFGVGMNCPSSVAPGCRSATGIATGSAVVLLPEPVDTNHTQFEARLNYAGEKLRMSGGYYGSFFNNAYGSITPGMPASLNNPLGSLLPLSSGLQSILSQPVALPPDNQAHVFDITGAYTFTPTTHGTFKLSYSTAAQEQDFAASGFNTAPSGVANLGGEVDTTLVQLGLSSRPWPKLALTAKLRYEDTDDRTPLALYNTEGAATNNYTNRHLPLTKSRANLLAQYQFNTGLRGSLGADFEAIDRGVFTASSAIAGTTALRQKTDETTVKAELRRSLLDNLAGAITVSSSHRDGSNWLRDNSGRGVTEVTDLNDPAQAFNANALFMPTLANRDRDKIRVHADWQPTSELSVQFAAEDGADRYHSPSTLGLRSTGMNQVSVDWDYAFNDNWHLNGYGYTGGQSLHQARPEGVLLTYDNVSSSIGLGFTGKTASKLELGGTLSFINDKSNFVQSLDTTASNNTTALLAATGGLPDIVFRQTAVNLFVRVPMSKAATLRFDVIHQTAFWNDWAWVNNGVPFTYSDGSTVSSQPRQSMSFIGMSLIYRWL
jgi:MtrB/PioB family decaheme-associated outer membrane protein